MRRLSARKVQLELDAAFGNNEKRNVFFCTACRYNMHKFSNTKDFFAMCEHKLQQIFLYVFHFYTTDHNAERIIKI